MVSPFSVPTESSLAWSRATRGSGDYAILVADPEDAKTARVVTQVTGEINPTDISGDKTQLLFTRDVSNRESKVMLLDLASGKVTEVTPGGGQVLYADPRFSADGRSIYVISNRDSDVRQLVQIDLATRKPTLLTPDLKWNVEQFTLSDDQRTLAYAINEDGYSRIVVRDLVTRRALPQAELPRGVMTNMAFSPDGKRLAFDLSTAKSAADVWTWDVASGAVTRWTTSELGALDPAKLVEPQLIHFKTFDGLMIPAFVYRPTGAAPSDRTPVIMDIHGGPESQTRPAWNVGAQYFADVLGATVILPNVRGSDGYGKRYLDLDNAAKREDSVKDIGALLDWIATQPGLDKDRVAVYGQSYGGYMSLAVMTHYADRLVGGVERYGISNFISFLNNTEAYRRENRRAEYGDERDPKMQAVFKRISPLANVAKITKPMLVMQGAQRPARSQVRIGPGRRRDSRQRRRDLVRRVRGRRSRLPEEAQQRSAARSRDRVPVEAVREVDGSGAGVEACVGAHRERAHRAHLRRNRSEAEAGGRQPAQFAQMLDDRDAGAEQCRVNGPRQVRRVVDVVGIDADEYGATTLEQLGRIRRQERMALEIRIGAPVPIPASVDQHGLAGHIVRCEVLARDGASGLARHSDEYGVESRE